MQCKFACTNSNGEATLAEEQLYDVQALKNPGPKWQVVAEAVTRAVAVKTVQAQWRYGRFARASKVPTKH